MANNNKPQATSSLNLKPASAYVNNLLLARGLLRNGAPINFARPHKDVEGVEGTMAKTINLIHDLILVREVGHPFEKCSLHGN
jgi:hypothetical protein